VSIYEKDMLGHSKHEAAIMRIREFCTGKRVLCAFSGGKDSQACYHLLQESGVQFHAEYSITRFEPPELLRFIRQQYPDVTFRRAYKMSLHDEIAYRGLPSMWARWCCESKHVKTDGYDIAVIGVRWEESAKRRSTWRMFGYKQDKTAYLCPICDWTVEDVWEYLGTRPHCSLYDEGFARIGCVCCPLAPHKMKTDAERWPKTAAMLRKAGDAFVARMRAQGFRTKRTDCASWSKCGNPEAEYWRRWITTGQTAVPIEEYRRQVDDAPCLFEGSGFSEKDEAQEAESER